VNLAGPNINSKEEKKKLKEGGVAATWTCKVSGKQTIKKGAKKKRTLKELGGTFSTRIKYSRGEAEKKWKKAVVPKTGSREGKLKHKTPKNIKGKEKRGKAGENEQATGPPNPNGGKGSPVLSKNGQFFFFMKKGKR